MIEELLKDLEVDVKEVDIKSVYRLGPLKTGISRPRSIKVHFTKSNVKGVIFRNIEKLQQIPKWKGVRISDAISPAEQRQQRDLRCIYAAAKARGINTKLRGSTIIIDDIKYTYKDIDSLPHEPLLNTTGFLYEATKSDLDFACGMVLSQCKDICKDNIPGKNLLGEILCKYRDAIVG